MAQKQKYYVVWQGYQRGIFTSWAECEKQVKGFPAAQYKSFDSLKEAEKAYQSAYESYKVNLLLRASGKRRVSSLFCPPSAWMRLAAARPANSNIAESILTQAMRFSASVRSRMGPIMSANFWRLSTL